MKSILLIGCGNMGNALLSRWLDSSSKISAQIISDVSVIEPYLQTKLPEGITHFSDISKLPENFSCEMIVLAVKPQQLDDLLPELAKRFGNRVAYLSIAAGKNLEFYKKYLGNNAQVIRAMPNLPATIGLGITAMIGNHLLSQENKNLANALMQSVGKVLWLEDEKQLDIVTAISGSGPAYFFMFMDCLVAAAVKKGLATEIAELLVKQTAIGASHLADSPASGLCDLINNVTSKGGTTAAARAVFEQDNSLSRIIEQAVSAAVKRAEEL